MIKFHLIGNNSCGFLINWKVSVLHFPHAYSRVCLYMTASHWLIPFVKVISISSTRSIPEFGDHSFKKTLNKSWNCLQVNWEGSNRTIRSHNDEKKIDRDTHDLWPCTLRYSSVYDSPAFMAYSVLLTMCIYISTYILLQLRRVFIIIHFMICIFIRTVSSYIFFWQSFTLLIFLSICLLIFYPLLNSFSVCF